MPQHGTVNTVEATQIPPPNGNTIIYIKEKIIN
jgi:hypothetical protein